jgi:hypothetical protein
MDFQVNEFPVDHAGEIALECEKLERALKIGMEEYDNSYVLLGKQKWYSLGLENNDGEKDKDDRNKKNILMQLIEKAIDFLKMIGAKIVEWYKRCKEAILKFFGSEKIDPKLVGERLQLLTYGLTQEDASGVLGKMSQEVKASLAEILDKPYFDVFFALYNDHKVMPYKCDTLAKFASNYEFFTQFKEKGAALKEQAKSGKLYEGIDERLAKILSSGKTPPDVKVIATIFEEAGPAHAELTKRLEKILKQLPNDDLDGIEGSDIDLKRRRAVDMVSSVIKINSDLVLKVNHYMQAVSVLMTYIAQQRLKKLVIIKM